MNKIIRIGSDDAANMAKAYYDDFSVDEIENEYSHLKEIIVDVNIDNFIDIDA